MKFCSIALAVVGLSLAGCGGPEGPPPKPRADVTGTVTVNGSPLAVSGYSIGFSTSETSDLLTIDNTGAFNGQAPVGNCTVSLVFVGSGDADPAAGHVAPTDSGVLEQYMSDDTAGLKATVKEGTENTFDFEVGQ